MHPSAETTPDPVRRRTWMLPRLPLSPASDEWSWQLSAQCRGEDPAIFFHPEGERGKARQRRARRAKAICAQCPVAVLCREHALRFQEPFGIWGGLSEDERLTLLTPPKHR
jgi:WhiB family transcriptional regulator, redox-sensing transcriptional regulator